MNKNIIALGSIGAITALIIYIIHLNAVLLPNESAKNDYWGQEAQYSSENTSLICPPSQNGQLITPESCKRQDHYRYDRQKQIEDHNSQVAMKNANWMSVLIGVGGLLLLKWTLSATQSAAKSASDTLYIAQKTFELSNKSNFSEFRPYVSIVEVSYTIESTSNMFLLSFKIKNIGRTPARKVCVQAQVFVVENSDPNLSKVFFETSARQRKQNATLLPEQEHVFKVPFSHPDEPRGFIERVADLRATLMYAGIVTYVDHIGKERRTIFKRYIDFTYSEKDTGVDGNRIVRGNMVLGNNGNSAS